MERLDLKFRAEPAKPARSPGVAGWWLWCLVGLAIGLGAWWSSRQYLARRLSDQLAAAQSPSEAFLALEGLLMLDAAATLEIVRGLQHPNPQIARTAYRTLDAQITGWQQLESSVATARMRSLAQRLHELPATTPTDNLVMASSLASRIFTLCLELDDPQLAPVMTLCESVFQRIGRSQNDAVAEAERLAAEQDLAEIATQINDLQPPPPLAPTAKEQSPAGGGDPQFTAEVVARASLADGTAAASLSDAADSLNDTQNSSTLAAREAVHSSTSSPTARVQFLTSATRPRTPSLESSGASVSLSDANPAALSLSDEPTAAELSAEQPVSFSLGDEPPDTTSSMPSLDASSQDAPLVRMRKLAVNEVDLQGMQQLEIDQLVRLLGSVQPRVAQAAALALRAKEMPDERLALASELATAPASRRLEILEQIAVRSDLDPRPWLLWMAEDGEAEVRQRAVALLSSMSDLGVQRQLRQLLAKERNENVAHAIRQLLISRP